MSIADEIEKLNALKREGAITEEEFERAKSSLLEPGGQVGTEERDRSDEDLYAVMIHLTQLCGYIVPLAGLLVPIILWQLKKGESALLDLTREDVISFGIQIHRVILGQTGVLLKLHARLVRAVVDTYDPLEVDWHTSE